MKSAAACEKAMYRDKLLAGGGDVDKTIEEAGSHNTVENEVGDTGAGAMTEAELAKLVAKKSNYPKEEDKNSDGSRSISN